MQRQAAAKQIEIRDLQQSRTVLYIEQTLDIALDVEHIVSYRPHIRLLPAMRDEWAGQLAHDHSPI